MQDELSQEPFNTIVKDSWNNAQTTTEMSLDDIARFIFNMYTDTRMRDAMFDPEEVTDV